MFAKQAQNFPEMFANYFSSGLPGFVNLFVGIQFFLLDILGTAWIHEELPLLCKSFSLWNPVRFCNPVNGLQILCEFQLAKFSQQNLFCFQDIDSILGLRLVVGLGIFFIFPFCKNVYITANVRECVLKCAKLCSYVQKIFANFIWYCFVLYCNLILPFY